MSKTYPVEIHGYRRLGDDGCSLTVHTSVEVTSDDIKYLDESRGKQALLFITDTTAGIELPKIDIEKIKASMVENTVYNKDITPSERERRKIWVLFTKEFEREPNKEEFEAYYLKIMNLLDTYLSNKISSYEL